MKTDKFLSRLFCLSILGSLTLHAAILDDFVEKIQQETRQKKHYKKHHYHHQTTLSSDAKYQKALKFLGYYHGKIDGDLSTQASFDAIMAFHTKHNEIETGFLEEEDKRYLLEVYHTIILEKYLSYTGKNKKKNHQKLQAALAAKSLYNGKIDGVLGKASKKAFTRYKAQLETDMEMSKDEVENRLIEEAKEQIETKVAKIKEDTFDPKAYAAAPVQEDMLTE